MEYVEGVPITRYVEAELLGVRERVQLFMPVSYTHLRAHETVLDLVCRLLLEKKNNEQQRHLCPYTTY